MYDDKVFHRALTYGDFYRTGTQDCGNAMDYDEFDFRNGGTAEQIVDRTWADWEENAEMERHWLSQQDDFEGLDPHEAYEQWRAGWKACAVRAIERELEERRERAESEEHENPPGSPHRSGLTAKRAKDFSDSHNYEVRDESGTVVALLFRDPESREWYEDSLPGVPQTHYIDRWRGLTQAEALDTIARRLASKSNPPAGWWRQPAPTTDRPCYRTKSEALKRFLDVNSEIVENYGGADYEVSPAEFDAINHKYGLKGRKAVRTIADAVWVAMPVGKPFCLDRIDLEALNDTSPAREAGVAFRLPDVSYESKLVAEEARHYEREPEEPAWVSELEPVDPDAPVMLTPPEEFKPYRLQLEEHEPGVETYKMFNNPRTKTRSGVHVDASSPRMFREFLRLATPYIAKRADDGSFTVLDESRWSAILASCEAREVQPLRSNPAWVTNILSKHFVALEEEVPAKWLPKLTKTSSSRGKLTAAMKEYGCGAYGCVLPTLDPGVVLKLTTDDTEAEFAHDLAGRLTAPVVVKYHMTRALPERHKGRQSFLLWRDSADHVGDLAVVVSERGGDGVAAEDAIAKQHKAAQKAFDALYDGKPAEELLKKWEVAARKMGEEVPELRELAEGMITNLHKDKVFMGDVHGGNIGRVGDRWVVVDPGHVAVLEDRP